MKTFKKWMLNNFEKSELSDMVKHGVASGFSGLIYYSETTALYRRYQEQIWEMLYEDADNQGVNILQLIGSFNGAAEVGGHEQFENLLVWYAAEKIAWDIIENGDEDDAEENE